MEEPAEYVDEVNFDEAEKIYRGVRDTFEGIKSRYWWVGVYSWLRRNYPRLIGRFRIGMSGEDGETLVMCMEALNRLSVERSVNSRHLRGDNTVSLLNGIRELRSQIDDYYAAIFDYS